MTCPRSLHGSPSSCSQCLGAPAHRVDILDGIITVDSQPIRPNDEPVSPQVQSARRRGQREGGLGDARRKR